MLKTFSVFNFLNFYFLLCFEMYRFSRSIQFQTVNVFRWFAFLNEISMVKSFLKGDICVDATRFFPIYLRRTSS